MKPNVILVILDSVRARNMSLYGHTHETTPFLDSIAEDVIVYDQARSPSVQSIFSHRLSPYQNRKYQQTSTDFGREKQHRTIVEERNAPKKQREESVLGVNAAEHKILWM